MLSKHEAGSGEHSVMSLNAIALQSAREGMLLALMGNSKVCLTGEASRDDARLD